VGEVSLGVGQQEQIHRLTIFLQPTGGAWWLLSFLSGMQNKPTGKAISDSKHSAVYYQAVTFTVCSSKHMA